MSKVDSNKITQDLINYLSKLKEEEWKIMVTSEWNVHDVFAHLIGWTEEVTKVLPSSWKSQKQPWFISDSNYKEFNDKAVLRYKDLKPPLLIKRFEELNKKLGSIIDKIGEETIRRNKKFNWVLDEEDDNHEKYHLDQIKKALKSNASKNR